MKTASIVLRILLTLALGAVLWAFAGGWSSVTPAWLTAPILAFLVTAWAVIFIRLRSPRDGLWALALLTIVAALFALFTVVVFFGPGRVVMPDWTLPPLLAGTIAAWLLLLSASSIMRVVHALVWGLGLHLVAALPSTVLVSVLSQGTPDYAGLIVFVITEPVVICVWVMAILRRWSIAWPVAGLAAVFSPIVGAIGFGRLVVSGVGCGETLAPAQVEPDGADVRPRGLVESANYE